MADSQSLVPEERIIDAIILIRDQKVMLDADLAALYGVETRALVQAVKRNLDRFPGDFMFQLDASELDILRSQNVMSRSWGGARRPPYAFTEQGVAHAVERAEEQARRAGERRDHAGVRAA